MSNRRNNQFVFTPHNKTTLLDCSFIVDSSNGNGLGIRSLKGSGRVANVFMNTSATPASNNPNPAAGYIVVQLQDNYNRSLCGCMAIASPTTGVPMTTGLTVGVPFIIVSLGSTTTAQWQTAGLASTVTPAVGASFIAAATSVAGGGSVIAAGTSGIETLELIGDPNLMNSSNPSILSGSVGMQFIFQCLTGGVLATPVNGTVISLMFELNDSAQGV